MLNGNLIFNLRNQWLFKITFLNWVLADLLHFQGISTRRQRSDLFGLRVKLPPVTITSLTHSNTAFPRPFRIFTICNALQCHLV